MKTARAEKRLAESKNNKPMKIISHANSIATRVKHFAYLAASFAVCMTARASEDITVPLPPDYTKAESLIAEVESSTELPADAKRELQQQYSNAKTQFDAAWAPLQSSVKQLSARAKYWEQTLAERDKDTQQRNANTPTFILPDQAGAKQAYDNQVRERGSRNQFHG